METTERLSTPNTDVLWELPLLMSSVSSARSFQQSRPHAHQLSTETRALVEKETNAPKKVHTHSTYCIHRSQFICSDQNLGRL